MSIILVILAIIMIFSIVGNSSPYMTDSADNVSGSGLPLAGLYSASGVIMLIVMVGIFLACIGIVFLSLFSLFFKP